jgi:hypothetical protein
MLLTGRVLWLDQCSVVARLPAPCEPIKTANSLKSCYGLLGGGRIKRLQPTSATHEGTHRSQKRKVKLLIGAA